MVPAPTAPLDDAPAASTPAGKPARKPARPPRAGGSRRPRRSPSRSRAGSSASGAGGDGKARRRRGPALAGTVVAVGLATVIGLATNDDRDDADAVDTSTLDTGFLSSALATAEREVGERAVRVSLTGYGIVVESAPLPVGAVAVAPPTGAADPAPDATADDARVTREFSVGPEDSGYRVYVAPVGDYVPPALQLDDLDLDRIVREVRAALRAVDGVEYFTASIAVQLDGVDASARQLELTTSVRGSDERLERTLVLSGPNVGERTQERRDVD